MALFKLTEGEYAPLSAAAAGSTFTMSEPFAFAVDPADLLDEEAPEEDKEAPEGQADAES
ncbi:hypothetical protein AB0J51_30280 [Micromonospora echinofusca]|uniref:hypothetical protein n=1 Tax=Micromonospora echinofusca TaxID=47858 RepID=UPI00343EBAA1